MSGGYPQPQPRVCYLLWSTYYHPVYIFYSSEFKTFRLKTFAKCKFRSLGLKHKKSKVLIIKTHRVWWVGMGLPQHKMASIRKKTKTLLQSCILFAWCYGSFLKVMPSSSIELLANTLNAMDLGHLRKSMATLSLFTYLQKFSTSKVLSYTVLHVLV